MHPEARHLISVPLVVFAALACGDDPAGRPADVTADAGPRPDAVSADGGLDGGMDAGPDAGGDGGVDAGECDRDPEGRCRAITWTEASSLSRAVDHHSTFARETPAGSFVYLVGGIRTRASGGAEAIYRSTQRFRLDADRLEVVDGGDLPFSLAFHAQALTPDRVYLLGGVTLSDNQLVANSTILLTRVDASGTASFEAVGALPEGIGLLHATAEVLGTTLYVIGGSTLGTGEVTTARVLSAPIDDDGRVGTFTDTSPLPSNRSHHASLVTGGRIIVVGGYGAGRVEAADVLRSLHDASGALIGWERAGSLGATPWTHSAFTRGRALYVVGGGEGGPGVERFVSRVRRAFFDSTGALGDFEDVGDPLPLARSHVHQTPILGDRVVSLGGRVETGLRTYGSTARVFVGRLLP